MRLLIISLVFCIGLPLHSQSIFADFDAFFSRHVKKGLVNYSSVVKHKEELQVLKNKIAETNFLDQSIDFQKAFLINSYNLLVIAKLAEAYPVDSPKSIGGFFIKKDLIVGGKKCSLDQLENDLLFGLERDPRFHLVLICGAMGCPPFPSVTFTADGLEQELEQASREAINHPVWVNEKEHHIEIAQIFQWYGYDIGDPRNFLPKYRPELSPDKPFRYIDYDWGINDYQETVVGRASFMTPSQLLSKGTWEIKAFQSVYAQKNRDGFDRFNTRATYFSSFNQFNFGVNAQLNTGLDVVWKKNLVNDFAFNNWWDVFKKHPAEQQLSIPCFDMENYNQAVDSPCFNSTQPDILQDSIRMADAEVIKTSAAQGLAHLGPKIKFRPFKKISNLTLLETVYIPIDKAADGQLISFTQFFYDQNLGSRTSLFLELSFWTPITPDFKFFPFFKSFWSYFPNRHISAYAMLSLPGEYGAGVKINITRRLELEMLHTRYLSVERFFGDRTAQTWNVGLRVHP